MRKSARRRRRTVVAGLVVLATLGFWSADDLLGASAAVADASGDSRSLIVGYGFWVGEIAETDRGPILRVYGDGLVRVHYPAYMTRAGDYTLQLSAEELSDLLASLSADGLLEFDAAEARTMAVEIDTRKRLTEGTMHYVSDRSTSVIELHLDRYKAPAGTGSQRVSGEKTIRWTGLQSDARLYPEHAALQRLAAVERQLRALMERSDLLRLATP